VNVVIAIMHHVHASIACAYNIIDPSRGARCIRSCYAYWPSLAVSPSLDANAQATPLQASNMKRACSAISVSFHVACSIGIQGSLTSRSSRTTNENAEWKGNHLVSYETERLLIVFQSSCATGEHSCPSSPA
jgi:hypothetical protein